MKCGEKTEVYSRVTGYFRPITNWNKGKRAEFADRKTFNIQAAAAAIAQKYPKKIFSSRPEIEAAALSTPQKIFGRDFFCFF